MDRVRVESRSYRRQDRLQGLSGELASVHGAFTRTREARSEAVLRHGSDAEHLMQIRHRVRPLTHCRACTGASS